MKGQHSPGMSSQSVIVVTGGVRCLRNGLGTVCHASVAALACNPAPILLAPKPDWCGIVQVRVAPRGDLHMACQATPNCQDGELSESLARSHCLLHARSLDHSAWKASSL